MMRLMRLNLLFRTILAGSLALHLNGGAAETHSWKFFFGDGRAPADHLPVGPGSLYGVKSNFGFEPGATDTQPQYRDEHNFKSRFYASDQPFSFSVALSEGNYKVTVTLGGPEHGSTNTVKSELRRLMLENIVTEPGKFETRTFSVNVRQPRILNYDSVHLKDREKTNEMWNWDEKLTLEVNGTQP